MKFDEDFNPIFLDADQTEVVMSVFGLHSSLVFMSPGVEGEMVCQE